MLPIVTLTMNPAVDVCASVEHVRPVHKLRCVNARRDAGGGGINVARVARRLGADPFAIFPAGGPVGALLDREISAENVRHRSLPISGDTREDFTINETGTGRQFRFVLPGPVLADAEIETCLAAIARSLAPSAILVASGSLPPGVPGDFYSLVGQLCTNAGAKFVLDSSGPALRAALGRNVFLIKPSFSEFSELIGREPAGRTDCLLAAKALVAEGAAQWVALTLGDQGALLVGNDRALFAGAPKVNAVSAVGAGDSFLGALAVGLARGDDLEDALALAVAAGSAALLSPGTDLCHTENVRMLRPRVHVRRVHDQNVISSIS